MKRKIPNVITLFLILSNLSTIDTEKYLNTLFTNSPGIYFEPIRNLKFTETKYHLVSFIKIEDTILIYTSISQMYKTAVLNCKNKNIHFCLEITNNDRFENQKVIVTKLIQEIKFYLQHTINIFPQSTPKSTENFEFKQTTLSLKFNCAKKDIFIFPHSIIETTQNCFQKIIDLENHKHWIIKRTNEKPIEINTIHIKRWLDSIHEILDFYILTLQNILTLLIYAENMNWHPEHFPLTAVDLYQQVLQKNFMNYTISLMKHLSKIEYFSFGNQLMFILNTPVISEEKFQFFKIHKLPINHNIQINKSINILIESNINYIILSHDYSKYRIIKDSFFENCISIANTEICNTPPLLQDSKENMICEISLLTEPQPYKCNYQINFDDFPLITPLESYYGWLYATNTVKQVEFQCEDDSTFATTISDKGILQLHPSCRIKNHNFPNQTKPLKYLEPNISKPLFDISLKLIAPFFNQFITEKPLELHKIIGNYKNRKISLQELEYEIKISEKINTALNKNLESKSNYFHDSITKLIIAVAVTCLLILTLFIFFYDKNVSISSNNQKNIERKYAYEPRPITTIRQHRN